MASPSIERAIWWAGQAARILDQFRVSLSGEENLTFNPGMMIAGTDIEYDVAGFRGGAFGKNNAIAKCVLVTGGIRDLLEIYNGVSEGLGFGPVRAVDLHTLAQQIKRAAIMMCRLT